MLTRAELIFSIMQARNLDQLSYILFNEIIFNQGYMLRFSEQDLICTLRQHVRGNLIIG